MKNKIMNVFFCAYHLLIKNKHLFDNNFWTGKMPSFIMDLLPWA